MLLLIALGFGLTKKRLLTDVSRGELTNLVIYVVLPCNIFASFKIDMTRELLTSCAGILVIGFAAQALYIVLNRVLYIKTSPARRVVMQYATICNNSGFLGLPVMEAVFGDIGLLYGAVMLIPIRIFMWTAGLSLFTVTNTREKIKTLATHPCIWAVFLGFGYSLLPFELPGFFMRTVDAVGGCTTALSMLIVGAILTDVKLERARGALDRDCLYYSALRLIAIPGLIFAVLRLLGTDGVITGVAVLSAAMPAATTTAMLARKYGGDSPFAARLIMVSTLLSLVTLPLVSEICLI
jgi:predicted permease